MSRPTQPLSFAPPLGVLDENIEAYADKRFPHCDWKWDEDHLYWDTNCNQGFCVDPASRKLHYKFCPECGMRIMVIGGQNG